MIEIEPQILLTNVVAAGMIVINLVFGFTVFYKSVPRELKIVTLGISLITVFFIFFFVMGFNVRSPELSLQLFSFSAIVFLLGPLVIHLILAAFRVVRSSNKKKLLSFFYLLAIALTGLVVAYPQFFLDTPKEGLVFPSVFTGGEHHIVSPVYWGIILVMVLTALVTVFLRAREQDNLVTESKVLYTFMAVLVGGGFGVLGILTAYEFDVSLSNFLFFGLFIIPLTYGTASRHVNEIASVLKRVWIFLLLSIMIAFSFGGIVSINNWFTAMAPGFPQWVVPLMSSFFAVALLMYFWYTYTDTEVLKYEFISVVTHKFRTPLTRIKWSVQMLKNATDEEEKTMAAEEIAESAQKLVDLTDILVDASKMEGNAYQYKFKVRNLNYIVEQVYDSVKDRMEDKDIKYGYTYDDSLSKIYADDQRLKLALQILFENAISYTPKGGSVSVNISKKADSIIFSITDTGIGISTKEQNYIFSKFYRSQRAKLADPNGMGIGIFMAKKIIERHEGKIWATSPGPNSGSTFWVSFPNAAH
ncbi:MAG: ATP-binding protein [Candidatus Paceibacterota bacterium]